MYQGELLGSSLRYHVSSAALIKGSGRGAANKRLVKKGCYWRLLPVHCHSLSFAVNLWGQAITEGFQQFFTGRAASPVQEELSQASISGPGRTDESSETWQTHRFIHDKEKLLSAPPARPSLTAFNGREALLVNGVYWLGGGMGALSGGSV